MSVIFGIFINICNTLSNIKTVFYSTEYILSFWALSVKSTSSVGMITNSKRTFQGTKFIQRIMVKEKVSRKNRKIYPISLRVHSLLFLIESTNFLKYN